MLTRFIVHNHRSLRDEQTLSLGTDRSYTHPLIAPPSGQAIVRVAGLFGANASGKSNVIDALRLMRTAVLDSQARWTPGQPLRLPYALRRAPLEHPSTYAVDFVLEATAWQYGFTYAGAAVQSEWLHQWPDRRKRVLFERTGTALHFPGRNLLGTMGGADPILHRDEVWLCEKGMQGDTRVIRLAEGEVRKDERLDRRYLQGRYGGIPMLGDLAAPVAAS